MNFKPGALVMLLKAIDPLCIPLIGTVQTLDCRGDPQEWILKDIVVGPWRQGVEWHEEDMKVIDPGSGNESFVVKARKTLPRPTPVTGPVTIDHRGEVV